MNKDNYTPDSLEGTLLIATPLVDDLMFMKSVIYVIMHNEEGAMGLVVNRVLDGINCKEVFSQLSIDHLPKDFDIPIHFGGPAESTRGFVLHSNDYQANDKIKDLPHASLSANVEILKDIVDGKGPHHFILALGYASWKAGQLEEEIQENSWIHAPATEELIFETDNHLKWKHVTESLGFNMLHYNTDAGHS